jgi:hypothetical protein
LWLGPCRFSHLLFQAFHTRCHGFRFHVMLTLLLRWS